MSGDLTRPMATPAPPPGPRAPRRRRWPLGLAAALVVILALLVVADRAAAAYAGRRIAQQLHRDGLPATPAVTVEGFPFLTQVLSHRLQRVHVTASGLREGPVTASLVADATGIRLEPSYQGGVITQVKGRVLVGFGSLANVARAAGISGVTASADGPGRIRFKVSQPFITTTVVASIRRAGQRTFVLHIISAGGLPASLLGPLRDLTFHVPPLPYGITIQSVSVTSQGVTGHLTGHDIAFRR